jgi:hypothetical protein
MKFHGELGRFRLVPVISKVVLIPELADLGVRGSAGERSSIFAHIVSVRDRSCHGPRPAKGQTEAGRYLIVFFVHKIDGRAFCASGAAVMSPNGPAVHRREPHAE